MTHPIDHTLLSAYALGDLNEDEALEVERALRAQPELAAALRQIQDDLTGWAADTLDAVAPPPSARDRLLRALPAPPDDADTVAQGRPVFAHLDAAAALIGISLERAEQALEPVLDVRQWMPMGPGVRIKHLFGIHDKAYVSLMHIEPGHVFPEHTHLGDEHILVLEGGFVDSNGRTVWAGERLDNTPGSHHHLTGVEGRPCIALVVLYKGFVTGAPETI